MFIFCVCCVLCRKQPLQWPDHSFRGVLPDVFQTVYCLEMSRMRQPRHDFDCCTTKTKNVPRTSDCNENLNIVIVFNSIKNR